MFRIIFALFISFGIVTSINAENLNKKPLRLVISISAGLSNSHVAQTQSNYIGSPAVQSAYLPNHPNTTQSLFALFAGAEYSGNSLFNTQFGLGYYYTPATNVNGVLQQSITNLGNLYNYQYAINTQQLLAEGKLLFKWHKRILPYISLGIGAAFNHAGNYSATPQSETAGPPPVFAAHNQTSFSYSLGLGIEFPIQPQLRVGAGYRYSNLGAVSLGTQNNSGILQNKNYYSNAILANLTYLF
jgi:opacity protein-like surface antigen